MAATDCTKLIKDRKVSHPFHHTYRNARLADGLSVLTFELFVRVADASPQSFKNRLSRLASVNRIIENQDS